MKLLPYILFEKCIRILALGKWPARGTSTVPILFPVVREIQRFTRSVRIG